MKGIAEVTVRYKKGIHTFAEMEVDIVRVDEKHGIMEISYMADMSDIGVANRWYTTVSIDAVRKL